MARPRTIGNMIAPWRFIVFIALFVIAAPVTDRLLEDAPLAAMAAFDIAGAIFLILCLPLLGIEDPAVIEAHAAQNDVNRTFLLVITGIVTTVLLLSIAAETVGHPPEPFTRILIIATLAIAWLFSNTVYALHYAHLAYLDKKHCAGLDFPNTDKPVYSDFVYFSFGLGMTFQTSDVAIRSAHIRRVVTVHCIAAFVFNIGVLAFTINVLGSR